MASGRDAVAGLRAVVAGFGPEGFAAADNLLHLGAQVVVLDEDPDRLAEEAELLTVLGADVRRGPGSTCVLPAGTDLLVVPPGWADDAPLVVTARAQELPIWSDAELAWRLADPDVPWLVLAGPAEEPGVAETARMLEAVLRAAGLRVRAAGPTGRPAVEVAMDPGSRDVLVVALDDTQLAQVHTLSAQAAAVLVGDDDPETNRLLGRAYERVSVACVYDTASPSTEELVRDAEVVEGARAIGLTLGTPAVGTIGLVEDLIADRAFVAERATSAAELATLADLDAAGGEPDADTVRHALTAAALARAHGVPRSAVRDGLRAWAATREPPPA